MRSAASLAGAAVVAAAVIACTTATKNSAGDSHRVTPDEPWRTNRPPSGPVPDFKPPSFQRVDLKNGMAIYVVEQHALPIVAASVVVRAGSAQESAKEAGLAALTYDLLDEGAASMNNQQLANAFAALGARVSTAAGREHGEVSAEFLKAHLDAGLDLLQTVVRKPTFAQADFDRVKAQRTAALVEREQDPHAVASVVQAALLFGPEHPYGHDDDGTDATLEKITRWRVQRFWSDNAGPKNAALVLAGDITVDEAKALAEKHFGKWSGSAKPPKAPADAKARTALKLAVVDVPGAPQSVVHVARAVMAHGDPDEGAMRVFNEILGGAFSSRLNLKLREEKGWTYGVQSRVELRLGKGPFTIATDVETANTADAVKEIVAQCEALKTGGVSDDELQRAKDGYAKSLVGYLGTPAAQAAAAGALFANGLPLDYFDKRIEAVKAVKADDVKKIAERALVKDDMVIVVVGDKAALGDKLKELGDLEVFDKAGTAAPAASAAPPAAPAAAATPK